MAGARSRGRRRARRCELPLLAAVHIAKSAGALEKRDLALRVGGELGDPLEERAATQASLDVVAPAGELVEIERASRVDTNTPSGLALPGEREAGLDLAPPIAPNRRGYLQR